MKLAGRLEPFAGGRGVVRLTHRHDLPEPARRTEALLVTSATPDFEAKGFAAVLSHDPALASRANAVLPQELGYLEPGDVISIDPENGRVAVLYRVGSNHNSMLITERCNSRCVMCSQPPRDVDDGFHVDEIVAAIRLMSPSTTELGITGGEPTLYFEGLLRIIRSARDYLPNTKLHVLSNGRLFSYLRYAEAVAQVRHPDLAFGVPLYSSVPADHDFVVQARGAFEETVRGLMNLGRTKLSIELRVVIHEATYRGLPELARFITRNLPFVDQVSLMGLEIMGYTRANLAGVWIDPAEYQDELVAAVRELRAGGVSPVIFNHQLCLLRPELWPHAVKSISDWKNAYAEECGACAARPLCGGFFASAKHQRSPNIRAMSPRELPRSAELEMLPS